MIQHRQKEIAVIGAGSWGTALALLLARNGCTVRLWSNVAEEMEAMRKERVNRFYLPEFPFPANIHPCLTLKDAVEYCRDILMVVPSHAFRNVLKELQSYHLPSLRIAWGTKGLDPNTKQCMSEVVSDVFGASTPMAVLSGPSFAREVAAQLPTAVSLASNDNDFF